MPSLVVVESPGKIKKISQILGPGYVIKASVGHVRDLPKKALGVDLSDFMPAYEETERGADVLRGLKGEVAKADAIYIATDPDREGESIAWHLVDALKLKSPKRISFNEITPQAVKAAIASPRNLNMPLVRAADARRVLDRLIGWLVSPVLSDASGEQLSAGRVQSPAVRLVCERERAIRDFRPTNHYGVDLFLDGGEGGGRWKASWDSKAFLKPGSEYMLDSDLAARVAAVREVAVVSYEESETRSAPKPPFTTSALQQAASAALKMKPRETMEAAQRLYEAGLITYMRTDSPNLSDDGYSDVVAAARAAGWPVAAARRTYKAKDEAQEGHEAIRPTHCAVIDAGENEAERGLYKLIRNHTLASVLDDAVYSVRLAKLSATESGGAIVTFIARGKTPLSPGWKAVYKESADETDGEALADGSDNPVPRLTGRSSLTAAGGSVVSKTTKAPPRYKQATLVKELESRGIGRPSTYAAILENILGRGYVSEDSKDFLHAEPPGEKVVAGLAGKASFINYAYTRTLESQLDDIASGKSEYLPVISAAHKILAGELSAVGSARPSHACPKCGNAMRRRAGKEAGQFWWGCSGFPDCKNTMADVEGKPVEKEARLPADDAGARVYFVVDFEKRDAAKAAGLRWDGERKKWYAPSQEVAAGCKGFKKAG